MNCPETPTLLDSCFPSRMHETHFKGEVMWATLVANKLLRRPFFSNSFVADFPTRGGSQELSAEGSVGCSETELSEPKETRKYRLFAGTWNVGGVPPADDLNLEEFLSTQSNSYDIYVTGFQEVVPLSAKHVLGCEKTIAFVKWNSLIRRALNKGCGGFRCVVSKQMVGIMVSVWARAEVLPFIRHPSVSCVGCGVFGCLGNKGSVSARFSLHETSFCVVCCHLASGGKEGDEMSRNSNAMEIISRTVFPAPPSLDLPTRVKDHQPSTTPEFVQKFHRVVILLGDLNYRISLPEEETRALVMQKEWDSLLERDQLMAEMRDGGVFEGWREGAINFFPTYKYFPNSDEYYGNLRGRKCPKKRAPAWCDRIIWRGSGLKQTGYDRCESKHSDHRPVRATFSVEVEVLMDSK